MDARDDAVEEELIKHMLIFSTKKNNNNKHMLIYQKWGLQGSNEGRI